MIFHAFVTRMPTELVERFGEAEAKKLEDQISKLFKHVSVATNVFGGINVDTDEKGQFKSVSSERKKWFALDFCDIEPAEVNQIAENWIMKLMMDPQTKGFIPTDSKTYGADVIIAVTTDTHQDVVAQAVKFTSAFPKHTLIDNVLESLQFAGMNQGGGIDVLQEAQKLLSEAQAQISKPVNG